MRNYLLLLPFLLCPYASQGQATYFPPLVGTAWDTLSPGTLGWCQNRIDSLYAYLEQKNTKGFVVLKDGRIVLEKYFGTFTQDSLWYWASAGKTLTAFLVGMAQEQGYLDIDDSTSHYLGAGWTSCTPQQEGAITLRHQLTMTTGLNDALLPDPDCTDPQCLVYLADPGTRWAYHNAPYTLLRNVLENATGQNENLWTYNQVGSRIGMSGFWFDAGWNNVFFSTPRAMARYGLLLLNRGIWANDTLLHDQAYFDAMTTSSQAINESYGYLTWLNGQGNFMLPGFQFQFPGPLIPNAPADMFMAQGKNDQKIHVVPSEGLVVVRMGNSSDSTSLVPVLFDNEMWAYINALSCGLGATEVEAGEGSWTIGPNPFADGVVVLAPSALSGPIAIACTDALGRSTLHAQFATRLEVATTAWPPGLYLVRLSAADGTTVVRRIVKD
ncbi:MAG: serine hydrolase [Flavobacteriales bacterium]